MGPILSNHCIDNNVLLVKKLIADPIVPNAKNINAGVGAVVLDEGHLLVIKTRFAKGYKLPRGHIDPKETIQNALVREVYEETGVKVEFQYRTFFSWAIWRAKPLFCIPSKTSNKRNKHIRHLF